MLIPDPDLNFTHPGSRIRIRNTGREEWQQKIFNLEVKNPSFFAKDISHLSRNCYNATLTQTMRDINFVVLKCTA